MAGRGSGSSGLGLMGSHTARNLLRAGHELTVHSLSPAPVDALVAEGAARAGSPAEVAAVSDAIVTLREDDAGVEVRRPG